MSDNVNNEDNNENNNENNNELESPPKKQKTQEQLPTYVWFSLWRDGVLAIEADELASIGLCNIAGLKDAVKSKCPNILKDVDAGELTIYEPQKVDDDAKANFAEGKFGTKLNPIDKVPYTDGGELPFLVVAPKKTTPDSGPTDLTLRKKVFWQDHGRLEVKLQGKCLELQGSFNKWIQTEDVRFFIRHCYPELFNLAYEETCGDKVRGVKITGTPGVGKSCFLDYVLFRLLDMNKCVVYVNGNTNKVYRFEPNGFVKVASPLLEVLESGATKLCDFVLLDAPDYAPTCQGLHYTLLSDKPFIISMSPDPENYQTLLRHTRPVTFYMGTLSWDEAQAMWDACYQETLSFEQLKVSFELMGGIPRGLFEFHLRGRDDVITRDFKIKQTKTLNDVLTGIRKVREQSVEVLFKHLWSVYHLNPFVDEYGVTNYEKCDIAPYNISVEKMVLDALIKEEVQKLWKSYSLYSSRHVVLGGIQYEAYAHKKIISEGFNKCTAIQLNKVNTGRGKLKLDAPANLKWVCVNGNEMGRMANQAKEIQRQNAYAYLTPAQFNFPIIDAVLVTPEHVYLMQMKTGSPKRLKHKETSVSTLSVFDDITTSFVFVVPSESVIKSRFDSLHCQQFRLVLNEEGT